MSVLADWLAQRVGIERAWLAAWAVAIAAAALFAGVVYLVINGG